MKKTKFVKIRMSQEEFLIIQNKANQLSMTVSDFLRVVALKSNIIVK